MPASTLSKLALIFDPGLAGANKFYLKLTKRRGLPWQGAPKTGDRSVYEAA
ncbi:MAG: hypothetical protein PVS2B2_20880 [Candidatus Acidiferrum sp.]